MTDRKQLNVYMNGQKVGTLAERRVGSGYCAGGFEDIWRVKVRNFQGGAFKENLL